MRSPSLAPLLALGLILAAGSGLAQNAMAALPLGDGTAGRDLVGKPVVDLDAHVLGTIAAVVPGAAGQRQVLVVPTGETGTVAIDVADLLLIVPDQVYIPVLDTNILAAGGF